MIVLSSLSFGSLSTLMVLTMRGGLPLLPAMLWRYLIAALLLLPLVWRDLRGLSADRSLKLILVGGIGQATISFLSLRSLDYINVSTLGFLFYTYPAWVAIIARVTGREPLTGVRLVALGLAMGGILVMVGAPLSGDLHPTGLILGLGSAVLFAIYLPSLHALQKDIPSHVATFYVVVGVTTTFAIAAALTGNGQTPGTLSIWALVISLALIGTVIAFFTMITGLRLLGPLRTAIVGTVEPFFTAVLGVLVLRESFTTTTIIGGTMIAAAVMILTLAPTVVASRSR